MLKNKFLILILCWLGLLISCTVNVKEKPVYQSNKPKVKVENRDVEKEQALKAVENFHELFNQEKSQKLFELIDDKAQLKSDKVYFVLWMGKLQQRLGKFENAKMTNQAVFQKSNTYEVRFEFVSKFQNDSGTTPLYELFAWEVYKDGSVKLLDYINGKDKEE